jgi:hypothetical protein
LKPPRISVTAEHRIKHPGSRGIQHPGIQHTLSCVRRPLRDYGDEQFSVLREAAVGNVELWQHVIEAIDQELAKRGVTPPSPMLPSEPFKPSRDEGLS